MNNNIILYKALFNNGHQAIIVIDELGIIVQFNPAAERLFRFSAGEIVGKNSSVLMEMPEDAVGKAQELNALRKDGTVIDIYMAVSEAKIGDKTQFIAIITHIDEIFGVHKALQNLATFDILTKVYSRSYFETHAKEWFLNYQKNKQPFSLLMFDLNHFKNVNDELGHGVGDQLLITFAERLQSCLNAHDYLVRLGGDEFLVVMEGNTAATHKMANRLFAAAEKPYQFIENSLLVLPCIGVYAEAELSELSYLLRRADFALDAAKKSHHYIQYFTSELEERFYHERYLERMIREALIKPTHFFLVFQPQVDLHSNEVIGFEALLRLKYKDVELLPECFIPIIESIGWASHLNEMLLDKILDVMKKFQWNSINNSNINNKKIKIAFNFSPQVYHFKNHLESLLKKMDRYSYHNAYKVQFEIELTESKLMSMETKYPGQWNDVSYLVDKYHVHFAIDDFSREYSSIYRLLQYDVNTLKIDKTYVNLLNGHQKKIAKSIIIALATMGKELNITVMAEGIETQEQALELTKLGCILGQGFYFYHPLAPEKAFELIGVTLL